MGKQKCILGNNCPNQIAKRNQFQLSEDDSDIDVKESCVFCGSYTAKKKKKVEVPSSPWSSCSNEDFRMKRSAMTDIDSLCGMKTTSKKRKEDADDKIGFYMSQLSALRETRKASVFTISDDEDLSDSGIKSDYESPAGNAGIVQKKNERNGLNVTIRKGKIVSRSPSPEELDSEPETKPESPVNLLKSNGIDKNILNEESSTSGNTSRKNNFTACSFLSTEATSAPSPAENHESDEIELDSDNDDDKNKQTDAVSIISNDSKDLSEAGPSSRPDILDNSGANIANNSYETHHAGGVKSRFMNLTYMPKHKVERLLFKSFKLQILNEFSSSSDEDDIKIYEAPKKDKKRKRKGKSQPVKDKTFKSSQKIGSGFYRWKKRRRGNNWSDDDSNLTLDSQEEGSDDEDDSDDVPHGVQYAANDYRGNVNSEHDYSTSEFNKIAEANVDNLAFETEKLNWDDSIMIDDATMDSAVITLDDSPERFALPLKEPTNSVINLSDEDLSIIHENDLNRSDHLYCVNELKKESSPPKEPQDDSEKNVADDEVSVPQNKGAPQRRVWECPICFEAANGQEVAATTCGHMFCRDCIESYLADNKTACPTCRKEISGKALITLYDL